MGGGSTVIQFRIRNYASVEGNCSVSADYRKNLGSLRPESLSIRIGPQQYQTVQFIYTAKACAVPFKERLDNIIFRMRTGRKIIPFWDEDAALSSTGHASSSVGIPTKVWVSKSFYDLVKLALTRLNKSLATLSTLVSLLGTMLTSSLVKLNPLVNFSTVVELFAGFFFATILVLVIVSAFWIGSERPNDRD